MNFQFKKLDGEFTIAKFKNLKDFENFVLPKETNFFQLIKTKTEISVLIEKKFVNKDIFIFDENWTGFGIIGTLDLNLTGITAEISKILAKAKVNILATATYDTDYFFVPTDKWELAKKTLEGAGNSF